MASLKPVFFFFFFFSSAVLFIGIYADQLGQEPEVSSSSSSAELTEQLKPKVSFLESSILKANRDLQVKDESILRMEKIIQEKLDMIATLENKIVSLQQEELMKTKLEADSESKESIQVYDGWLPFWLTVHRKNFELYVMTQWNGWGKPVVNAIVRKVLEKMDQIQDHAKLWILTIKTEWVPITKEHWVSFASYLEPHVESLPAKTQPFIQVKLKEHWVSFALYLEPHIGSLTAKTREIYSTSKNFLVLHFSNLQNVVDPFIQQAHEFAEQYIIQVATIINPFMDWVHETSTHARYTVHTSRNFISSTALYHKQIQEMLKTNELTKALATMELAWFVATALLSLPVVLCFRLYSTIFRSVIQQNMKFHPLDLETSHSLVFLNLQEKDKEA